MAGAAKQVKRVTLELGGKSANIVFDDCDLETAAATAPYGVFDNAGQDCCARSRILVQRNVYDRFMELLEPAVKGVVVGDPTSRGHRDGTVGVRVALRVGGLLRTRRRTRRVPRRRPSGPGYWFPPTVLTPERTDRTVTEEIFGPVVDGAAVRRRGRRHRAGQRHPNTVCPARSGPTTCRGRCGCRGRWNRATCR